MPTVKAKHTATENASNKNENDRPKNSQTVAVDRKIEATEELFEDGRSELKICKKCGAYVSSEKNICPDCGNFLTDDVDEKVNDQINKQLDRLSDASDPFYPTVWQRALGYFSLVGAVTLGVMMLVSIYFEKFNPYFIIGIIAFADAYFSALHGEKLWHLERLGLAFTVDNPEDMLPGVFWSFGRKAAVILGTAVGIACAVFAFNGLLYQL